MMSFSACYVPVGVPTFHLESASDLFARSSALLRSLDENVSVPTDMLLSVDAVKAFLTDQQPDALIFQNLTFANAAYMSEVLRVFDGPVLLWTLREPVIDGTRLRLNSLTGAFSAGNTLRAFRGEEAFSYVFGDPEEEEVQNAVRAFLQAARIKKALRSLRIAAVGHTPQGFGFGRALDAEMMKTFGAELTAIEARELIEKAKAFSEEEITDWLKKTESAVVGLDSVPSARQLDHARLYRAYSEYVRGNGIGALASRCWPDFFTAFGTPVCTVLSLLNDDNIAAACEADIYGALSMWIGKELSGESCFFGDPVSLDEKENTLTFWHCGMAACSLARKDTGACVGVHPNRKIGPVMDFGCEAAEKATVFRIGRLPDGTFRFFIEEGEILDKPKQFQGTSLVFRSQTPSRQLVEDTVKDGWEPHFVVIKGHHAEALKKLSEMLKL